MIDNIDLLRASLKKIQYDFKIIAGIVLKDHIHILIETKEIHNYKKIISSFKANFSRNFPQNTHQTPQQKARREKGIWQRKYYDHVIRNDKDLNKHLDYIHYNSVKHYNISPSDWRYSSFNKFVNTGYYKADWCNLGDINSISELDLE